MKIRIAFIAIALFAFCTGAAAQDTEVKITLSEQFFETLLDAVFANLDEPKVQLSLMDQSKLDQNALDGQSSIHVINASYNPAGPTSAACDETVRLKKAVDGVRTAVRFRGGKIYAPIAFEGNYNPPLIGCIGFSGWAETNIDLRFDAAKNALVGHARVINVNLSGTGGIGSSLITRLVQNSIDKKINPLEIIKLDMLSFTAPIQDAGKLRMEAVGIRHVVGDKEINVFLKYKFGKG